MRHIHDQLNRNGGGYSLRGSDLDLVEAVEDHHGDDEAPEDHRRDEERSGAPSRPHPRPAR